MFASTLITLGSSRIPKPNGLYCLLALGSLLLALLAGCDGTKSGPLRLATNVWPGYEPLYLARERGKLDPALVRLVELSSASQVIQALRNDLIDAACVTLDEALLLTASGEALSVVLVTDISNGGDMIIGQPGINSINELPGKKVGYEAGALGAYMVVRAMEQANVDISTLKLVSLKVNEHKNAFDSRSVDAVVTFEPVAGQLLASGGHKLFDSSQIAGEIVDVLVVKHDKLQRKALQHLVKIWFESLDYLDKQPAEAYAAIGKHLGSGSEATALMLDHLIWPDLAANQELLQQNGSKSLRATAQRLQRVMLSSQLMKQEINMDSLFADAGTILPQRR